MQPRWASAGRPLVVAYGARAHIRHILCCLRAQARTPGQRCPARKYDTGLPPRRGRRVYRHTVARPPLAGRGGARTHQEEDGVRDGGTQGGGWEEGRDTTAPGGLTLVGLVPAAGDIRNTGGGGWGAGVNGRRTQVEARAGVHAQDKESGREGVDGGRGMEQKN